MEPEKLKRSKLLEEQADDRMEISMTKTGNLMNSILFQTSWATRLCSGFVLSALSLCLFVSMSLSVSLSLCVSVSPFFLSQTLPKLTINTTACWPAHPPSLSHTPPSLFQDKKFPVEAHFWLDELFYYVDSSSKSFRGNLQRHLLSSVQYCKILQYQKKKFLGFFVTRKKVPLNMQHASILT